MFTKHKIDLLVHDVFLRELQIEVIMRVARDPGIITALIGSDDRKMFGMP